MSKMSELLRTWRDANTSALDAAATIGTGLVAQPIAGISGLSALLRGKGMDQAAKNVAATQEKLTWTPRTDQGQRVVENVSKPFELLDEHVIQPAADAAFSATGSPALGAGVYALGNMVDPLRGKGRAARTPIQRHNLGIGVQMGFEPREKLPVNKQALLETYDRTVAAKAQELGVSDQLLRSYLVQNQAGVPQLFRDMDLPPVDWERARHQLRGETKELEAEAEMARSMKIFDEKLEQVAQRYDVSHDEAWDMLIESGIEPNNLFDDQGQPLRIDWARMGEEPGGVAAPGRSRGQQFARGELAFENLNERELEGLTYYNSVVKELADELGIDLETTELALETLGLDPSHAIDNGVMPPVDANAIRRIIADPDAATARQSAPALDSRTLPQQFRPYTQRRLKELPDTTNLQAFLEGSRGNQALFETLVNPPKTRDLQEMATAYDPEMVADVRRTNAGGTISELAMPGRDSRMGHISMQSDRHGTPYYTDATQAHGAGQKLYQALYSHLANIGEQAPLGLLSMDNKYRMLGNVLSTALKHEGFVPRTGFERSHVSTGGYKMPRSWDQKPTPEQLWLAEAGETDFRNSGASTYQPVDAPKQVVFDPFLEEFMDQEGQPVTVERIQREFDQFAPNSVPTGPDHSATRIGPKALMRSAVLKALLRKEVTPEQARELAKNWKKDALFPAAAVAGVGLQDEEQPQY